MFKLDSNSRFPEILEKARFETFEQAAKAAREIARFSDAVVKVQDESNYTITTFNADSRHIYMQIDDKNRVERIWLFETEYVRV